MRPISILTAIVVMATLYMVVMERDALFALATSGEVPSLEELADPGPSTRVEVAETAEGAADGPAMSDETPVKVVALKSTARVIDSAVVLRGETRAVRQVELRAETSGQVVSDPLRKGAFVEPGQTLCQIDPGTREASLAEAEARLAEARARTPEARARFAQAEAQLREARLNQNAASRLSQDGFASETRVAATEAAVSTAEAAVESARAGLETAKSGVQSAEAAVAAAKREIERLTISAPFAGLLEVDTAELGSLMQPGSLCATVIQLDPIIVAGYIPETQIDRVERGAQAGIRLSGGRELRGRVIFLSRAADETTRTFLVEIEVQNTDLAVRSGQTAEIMIQADGKTAHLLPQSALTLNDNGALGVRIVGDDNRVNFVPLNLVRDTSDGVWVSGLPEQASIIIVGQEYVREGVLVAPTYRDTANPASSEATE
ncbi:efflux RND transporter periplasmic adaptor subunit [Lutimaribacter sp. EGI FJ00015]|uniref:Efflux RND transporter periplasmic adaptor subunit n=1 Tax=Lutimaribacter degradans TaxID=2945989 RepID=A0ACC5ZTS4_9RHOB|nr:efflux RND transporter periplasmic adaptor subunit [Lutimaribacter sp. EGI FJ00013]MCM2561230.1 efflux RND transporter periplasmic adaptor subunit [Lutimaribacter sp. EGI FJ00013]MCO0611821.1 efflux RND transporter periplasmic adaptor subunit [Lutimaribacter sp. EGI FJ00015]MCO0635058.1 efflux RND transporter periplasmic adaptor subunit [Lutimaribacter sp. EGI FJ00014]